jgi:pyruvate/2-oxoglutarate dehydrogenase complex dihydrolipoamide acyltransferase (E2) component
MQKKDLKPGTVYGYVAPNRTALQPVLMLSTDLYTEEARRTEDGKRVVALVHSHPRATVGRSGGYNTTMNGYLILWLGNEEDSLREDRVSTEEQLRLVREQADKVTEIMEKLPSMLRSGGRYPVGKLTIQIVNSRHITGVWEDVSADRSAKEEATRAFNAQGEQWMQDRNERLAQARRVLSAAAGEDLAREKAAYLYASPHTGENGHYSRRGYIQLTVEQAEWIAAALAARPTAE